MKKRLRKKLRVGEFREFYFSVSFTIAPALPDDDRYAVLDELLEMIEGNGLQFGGGGHEDWQGVVTLDKRGSVTEQHRMEVRQWLDGHPQISDVVVNEITDNWDDRV